MSERPRDRSAPQFFVNVEAESGEHRVAVVDGEQPGSPLQNHGAVRVLSFEFTDYDNKADQLKLTVDNWDLSNFDDPVWKKGNVILASWGYPSRMRPQQRMVITSVKGAQSLSIEAKAEAVLLNRTVNNRLFENVTRSEVVRQIAEAAGFGRDAIDIEDTNVTLPSVQQARMTDAQLLRRMADEEGFVWYVDFSGFHFHQRRLDERPVRRYWYYTDPGAGDIISFNVENDVTAKPGRVRRRGRNPTEGEDVEGDSADTGAQPNAGGDSNLAPLAVLVDPELGRESRVPEQHTANVAQDDTGPTSSSDAASAQRQATARARQHRHMAVQLNFTAVGDPYQFAKTVIQLEGLGRLLSIRYYVKEVAHKLSASGYTMDVKCVSDGHGGHSTQSQVADGLELFEQPERNRGRQNNQEADDNAQADGGDGGSGGDAAALPVTVTVDRETGREVRTYQQPTGRSNRDDLERKTREHLAAIRAAAGIQTGGGS